MSASEIRKRNTKTDAPHEITSAEGNTGNTDEVKSIGVVAVTDEDSPKKKVALVRWAKGALCHKMCLADCNVTSTSNFHFNFSNYITLSCLSTDSFYNQVFFPFWKHLDDRGFGTPQPFICWLLIPFTLSMIVWYYSIVELLDMADWESKMGPAHEWIEPEETFTWGEL